MLRSWTKTFAPLLDNKHDIILDKGGGPEYLCCEIKYVTQLGVVIIIDRIAGKYCVC